ncbi:MAG: hypothetical protein ABEJ70_00995 [Halobacteriaceae archaeon]
MSAFVVDVKPSARRRNGAVGRLVSDRGGRHRFDSRTAAESWAADLSTADRPVWVRRANPDDRTGADAYLVSRRPRRGGGGETPGEQRALSVAADPE